MDKRRHAARRRTGVANYGLDGCSTGASIERRSCRSCSRSRSPPSRSAGRAAPLHSTLAPDAFEGQRALRRPAQPRRRVSRPAARAAPATRRLPRTSRARLRGLGGTAGGGFSVHDASASRAQTIDGERTLTTVIAQRPGSTSADADRDRRPPRRRRRAARAAELSGTAALLELARVFAARETKRTIVLVSTSGGSGGDAGAARLRRRRLHGPFDAAIVLGDLAGATRAQAVRGALLRRPRLGAAAAAAHRRRRDHSTRPALDPGAPSALGQLAHLAVPARRRRAGRAERRRASRPCSCRSAANAARRPHAPRERRAPAGPRARGAQRGRRARRRPRRPAAMQTRPAAAAQDACPRGPCGCSCCTLLLPPLIVAADGLARAAPPARAGGALDAVDASCALPVPRRRAVRRSCSAALGDRRRRAVRAGAARRAAVRRHGGGVGRARSLLDVRARLAAVARWLVRRLGWALRPEREAAGVGHAARAARRSRVVVWIGQPVSRRCCCCRRCTCGCCSPRPSCARAARGALALVALGSLPLGLLIAFYADQLGLGPGARGVDGACCCSPAGTSGFRPALLWSVALGCAAAAVDAVVDSRTAARAGPAASTATRSRSADRMSYAGPGLARRYRVGSATIGLHNGRDDA